MGISKTTPAKSLDEILKVNLKAEMGAVDKYVKILDKVRAAKDDLPYEFFKIEHDIRHIIMDEQEHVAELKKLTGQ